MMFQNFQQKDEMGTHATVLMDCALLIIIGEIIASRMQMRTWLLEIQCHHGGMEASWWGSCIECKTTFSSHKMVVMFH